LGSVEVDLSPLVMGAAGGTRSGCRCEQYGDLATGHVATSSLKCVMPSFEAVIDELFIIDV